MVRITSGSRGRFLDFLRALQPTRFRGRVGSIPKFQKVKLAGSEFRIEDHRIRSVSARRAFVAGKRNLGRKLNHSKTHHLRRHGRLWRSSPHATAPTSDPVSTRGRPSVQRKGSAGNGEEHSRMEQK